MTATAFASKQVPGLAGLRPFVRKRMYVALFTCFYVLAGGALFLRAVRSDTPINYALTGLFVVSPLLVYFLVRSPLATSLCAYVLFMPFDSLSRFSSFGTFTKVLGILCAITLLVRLLTRKDPLLAPRTLVMWLILLTWMLLSAAWAPGMEDASVALSQYVALIALFAILAITPVRGFELLVILASVVAAGVVAAGYDVYLFHHGQSLVPSEQRVMIVVGEARIDPNEYAAALMLPIAVALHFVFDNRSRAVRLAMIPALLVLFAGLAASGSRGGFLSLATVFAYLIFKSVHRLKLMLMLVGSVTVALMFNPGLITRFQQAGKGEGAGRGDIWRVGFQAFREHWLVGWGVGNFPDAYDATHLHVFTRYIEGWSWHAHNTVLMVATELGVVGLCLWAAALYSQFNVGTASKTTGALFELRIYLQAAFLGVFVAGLGTSNLNAKYAWLSYSMLVLLRGYVLTSERCLREATKTERPARLPSIGEAPSCFGRDPSHAAKTF